MGRMLKTTDFVSQSLIRPFKKGSVFMESLLWASHAHAHHPSPIQSWPGKHAGQRLGFLWSVVAHAKKKERDSVFITSSFLSLLWESPAEGSLALPASEFLSCVFWDVQRALACWWWHKVHKCWAQHWAHIRCSGNILVKQLFFFFLFICWKPTKPC